MNFDDKKLNNDTDGLTCDPASELGFLAAKVAYHNFEWRYVTMVMFNAVQALGLNTFLMNYQQIVIVKLGRFIPEHRVAVPQFVLFGEDASDLSSTLRWIVRSKYDSNAKFVIVCASHDQECDVGKLFETLQKLYIFNVVVLKTSNETKEPLAYTYQVILQDNCLNNVPYKLDLFTACNNEECFKNVFPEKLSNFHQCRLVMSTVELAPFMYLHNNTKSPSGIDGEIMMLAADMLNATLFLRTPEDGTDSGHYTNNNWTGSLGDIYNGRCHASVCSAPLTSNKNGNFQISFTYYSMDIVWATRLPIQKASWEKLLDPLHIYLRVILFFTFIVIIFMNIFCKTMRREVRETFKIEPPKYSFLFFSWVLFLGMPIIREPAKRSFLITVYTWIWFCFVIRSAYQAALINSIKHPAYLPSLKTFRDVLQAGYPYGGPATLKEYYYDDRDIYDNWQVVDIDNIYDTLETILDGTSDFVIASNKEIVKHHLMKYNGTRQLQIIPEKLVNSPTVVYFKKYSPLTTPLSYVLRIAFEAGFIGRIHDRYLDHDRKLLRRLRSQEPEPLSMKDFAGCFVILIVGWFLSATYFAVEYICGNLKD